MNEKIKTISQVLLVKNKMYLTLIMRETLSIEYKMKSKTEY